MANARRFPSGKTENTQFYESAAKTIGGAAVLVWALTSSFLTLQAADRQNPNSANVKKAENPTLNKSSKPRQRKASVRTSQNSKGPKPVNAAEPRAVPNRADASDVAALKELLRKQQEELAAQQQQIAELREAMEEQKHVTEALGPSRAAQAPNLGQVASLAPVIPVLARMDAVRGPTGPRSPGSAAGSQEETQSYTRKVDELGKSLDGALNGLAGFKFSGDFRLRFDAAARSSNSFAGRYQNVRGNYRVRLNLDKELNDQLSFHLQLGSGLANNPLTYNTGFGGFAARGPLFIGEAWASYHPNPNIDLRGGRIPELFADDSRFLFKEDIRFDGFQENFKIPARSNPLGVTRLELRAGQYILTNPNVQVLPSAKACAAAPAQVITKLPATITTPAPLPTNCAYLNAGYLPGGKVRDADLFHQGFAVFGDLKPGWHHQFVADLQWYRNQNQIALAATAAGAPLVVGTLYGTGSFLPISGTGTATTTPGGAIFSAPHFQIAHLKYRIGHDGWKVKDHEMPAYLEFHAARNVGTSFLNNAVMGIASFGDTKKAGDVRLLYGYAVKEGNSMISEVTDDYLGSNTGVNMRTHEVGFDVGLSRFLAWQNYLYIQNEISGNNALRHFFVPIPAGATTQYRVQSQLQFKF